MSVGKCKHETSVRSCAWKELVRTLRGIRDEVGGAEDQLAILAVRKKNHQRAVDTAERRLNDATTETEVGGGAG